MSSDILCVCMNVCICIYKYGHTRSDQICTYVYILF
jgi:hypothetical protein